ncbi:MAG: ribosome biogenesis GTP-binding protein YihA/YsxC [Melioribacteraceae bacterium]|nr:ribosome biogenesis GTP-binding protein YihA/YsxC [Melioribacteraceae bacterium]
MLKIKFIKSVYNIKDLPKDGIPELVLCGRSNVGKSSFINSLSKQNNIAKTSSTPGKTRSLNYYLVEDKFYLVDLPGYGYAKVSEKAKQEWQKLIADYLLNSKNISMAYHLIDSRHSATPLDILLNEMLIREDIPYSIILSKIDKLNQSQKSQSTKRIISQFPELSLNDNLFLFSSLKGTGKKQVETTLSKLFI